MSQSAAELLKSHAELQGLADPLLLPLAQAAEVRSYRVGDPLFQAGMPNDGISFVISGEVSVFLMQPYGEQELGRLGPGEVLGDLALSAPDKHLANVSATKQTVVVFLSLAKLDALRKDKPGVVAQLALRFSRRFALSARALRVEALLR